VQWGRWYINLCRTYVAMQMRGFKRMLFVSPEQLYRLYCYPDTHLLRRR
jgi:hypothetical protein